MAVLDEIELGYDTPLAGVPQDTDPEYLAEKGVAPEPLPPAMLLEALIAAPNIADLPFVQEKLGRIASDALDEYELDKGSMAEWLKRMEKGLDLAKMVRADKTYPFPNCSNVKYPLVTTAALQFNAKAYPAIVPGDDIVKVRTYGSDPSGEKAARAQRVGEHMSYQLSCKIEEWEEETDKLLTMLPIVGTVIRKVWYDPAQGRIRVRLLETGALIVNEKVRSLADAPRVTEELSLYPSEVQERKISGTFRRVEYADGDDRDPSAPLKFIEQHRRIDLDEDGYAEPYIVTVHTDSHVVARIVADFTAADVKLGPDGSVTSIRRGSYFVAYHLLPSLDGGFWGTGFGLLLGDISDTINSIINQMLDAGHMASRGGGFIGAEFRIKGGSQQFRPGEWKMVNVPGASVREAIVPMTFPQPDATLFQMFGALTEAGREVASVKDILMGETGGRNMTATTTMALIEQGMAQFTAAYKRIFRALRHEFKLIARINADTVTMEEYNAFLDAPQPVDPRADYGMDDMDIVPVADPSGVTKMQRLAKAQVVQEAATQGMADPAEAAKRMFEAAGVEDIEELLPKPPDPQQQAMQAQMMQMQMMAAAAELMLKRVGIEKAIAEVEETKTKSVKNLSDVAANEAGIRFDALKLELERMRGEIDAAVSGGLGGMAGQPNEPAGPGPTGGAPGFAPEGGGGGVLGGPPMVGSGPAIPGPGDGAY